jgi:hypothetical protein
MVVVSFGSRVTSEVVGHMPIEITPRARFVNEISAV